MFRKPVSLLLALCVLGAGAVVAFESAEAQMRRPHTPTRSIQRSIQKNVEIKVKRMLLKLRVERSAGPVTAMDMGADGRYLATFSDDGTLRLWDIQVGREVYRGNGLEGPVRRIAFTPDGRRFVLRTEAGVLQLRRTDSPGEARRLGADAGPVSAVAVSPSGSYVAAGGADGRIHLYGLGETAETLITLGRAGPAIRALDVGAAGQHVLAAAEDGTITIFEAGSGTAVASFRVEGTPQAVRFGRNEAEFVTAAGNGVAYWQVDRDQPVRSLAGAKETVRRLAVRAEDGAVLGGTRGGRVLLWPFETPQTPKVVGEHPGGVSAVRFDLRAGTVLAAGADGLTRFWDTRTEKTEPQPSLSLIATESGWGVVDGAGRFDGSDEALRNVQWAGETQVLPVENFSDSFYEPGLLAKQRTGADPLMTDPEHTIADGILPPPTTRVEAPGQLSMPQRQPIDVSVEAVNEGGGIKEVRLYHNGKIVDPDSVTDRREQKNDAEQTEAVAMTYRVLPVAGDNVFTARAVSDESIVGMAAETATMIEALVTKPVLHLVAIGINDYQETPLSLNYARVDAEGILKAVRDNFGAIFAGHRTYKVYDQKATTEGILGVIDQLRETAPEDVVVIYYAGHGEAHQDEFYLVPYEFPLPFTDDSLVANGLPSKLLRERIQRIGARRVLMLVDACKSGTAVAAFKDYMDKRALHRLGSTVGLHIVAATAKSQLAAELPRLQHGVFTYTMIKGLNGGADRRPRDGNLTVREITSFAEDRVPEFSMKYARHQQWPLVFSRGLDFTLHRLE